jgi:hypothetical protein
MERLWFSVPQDRLMPAYGTGLMSAGFASRVRSMAGSARAVPGDPLARQALSAGTAWLASAALDSHLPPGEDAVLGQGDGNLANFLWDGDGGHVSIVDFEDSGPSDRAFELAALVEHLSAWPYSRLDAESFLGRFSLTRPQRSRLTEYRRLSALFWLLMLLPGGPASTRNPPGTLDLQASRLLTLLG